MFLKHDIHISIISPVYQAEEIVDELVQRITGEVSKITGNYEIILVEDGGVDDSWGKIVENCKRDDHITGIKLSKNFGQHYAIRAGLDHCRGEWVVVMDCDLQDRPEEIRKLYHKAMEGYDVVHALRARRRDNFLKRQMGFLYRIVIEWLADVKTDRGVTNFGIYNKRVIAAIKAVQGPIGSFVTSVIGIGFKTASIEVTHAPRLKGKSSYTLEKLMKQATLTTLVYSDKPLRMTAKLGLLISLSALLFAGHNLYKYFTGQIHEPGFTSLILSVWLLGGLIIFLLGVVGLYIGNIFSVVKNTPLYIVETICSNEQDGVSPEKV